MSSSQITALIIALAAGGASVTIAKSKLFRGVRARIQLGGLLSCPYCICYWLVAVGVAVFQPNIIGSGVLDQIASWIAITTVATVVAAILCRAYSFANDGGTVRVYIESDGTGAGTRIFTESGERIVGVQALEWRITHPRGIAEAKLTIHGVPVAVTGKRT